ncbi:MAG: glycosyltransferase family 4 protein [Candidatus Hydrogenedentes bacterium]|nr:glycosyltransferase family 4 protein [Candidatus Hydrogenedentota bacterium]
MRVGIDAHALGTGAGGNETYVRDLIIALRDHAPEVELTAYVGREGIGDPCTTGVGTHTLPIASSYVRVPVVLPWLARRTKVELLHVQYNAPPVTPCPFVVSVHDVAWKRAPESLRAIDRWRLVWLTPGTLRRARRIFVLTNAIKDEIMEYYQVLPERFDIVQPTVDPLFHPRTSEADLAAITRKYRLPEHYVLYIGALQPRKNLVRLATAFARTVGQGLPHSLIVVGRQAWLYGDILEQIDALKLGDRLRFTGYVPREELPFLLTGAAAFAYLSIYEGFGIPVLEAMACGTPVLTSAVPAIQEVAGDGAVFCDPFDVDTIEYGLTQILTANYLTARMRQNGPLRARSFTREKMAQAALEGYRKALIT